MKAAAEHLVEALVTAGHEVNRLVFAPHLGALLKSPDGLPVRR
jgi:hypothetical protein